MTRAATLAGAALATWLATAPVYGQITGAPAAGYTRESGMPISALPEPLREVGFDQHLDQLLPLDVPFVDEQGRTAPLGEYFGTRPVVLAFVYYECPMLCTQTLNSLAGTLDVLALQPHQDFDVLTISIDPRETPALAAAKKAAYLERYTREGAADGWHFLTGDQASIDRVTRAAGFRFVWDESIEQFAHPAGIMVLTPEGRIARYLFGIQYGPRDLRFALIDASAGTIGSPIDDFLLYCYHYDPTTGRYGLVIMRAIRLAGVATVLALGTFIGVMLRRDKRGTS